MTRKSLLVWTTLIALLLPWGADVWGDTSPWVDSPRASHPGALRDLITAAAAREGLDPALVEAVVAIESAFNPRAISRKGAMGLMQLMPQTAARYGVSDPFDPEENLTGGIRYLRDLLHRFDGDLRYALAAYNAGETAVLTYGGIPPYRETREYVRLVLARYRPSRVPVTFAPIRSDGQPASQGAHGREDATARVPSPDPSPGDARDTETEVTITNTMRPMIEVAHRPLTEMAHARLVSMREIRTVSVKLPDHRNGRSGELSTDNDLASPSSQD